MRILWDMRLYSYGYGTRGCGVWTKAMALSIKESETDKKHEIIIWGNKKLVPHEIACLANKWVQYEKGSWKSDLFIIPYLVLRYRVNIFHYWMALGPIFKIGMGLFHPNCKVCLCVYDLGVEYLSANGHCAQTRGSVYWKVQKRLLKGRSKIIAISEKTKQELFAWTKGKKQSTVLYMPLPDTGKSVSELISAKNDSRCNSFVTLGGALHKNVSLVIEAFELFRKENPCFSLHICGTVEKEELPQTIGKTVFFETYSTYEYYLKNAAAIIVASTYEGLGIPLLEAMRYSCPLIASDISVFHESCGDFARFMNPRDAQSIAEAMQDIVLAPQKWADNSARAMNRYRKMSENAGKQWLTTYANL